MMQNIPSFERIQYYTFTFATYFMYIFYIIIFFGTNTTNAIKYLSIISLCVKTYISLFLIINFNPWRETKFTRLDKDVAFNAGIQLLLNTAVADTMVAYLENLEKKSSKSMPVVHDLLKVYHSIKPE